MSPSPRSPTVAAVADDGQYGKQVEEQRAAVMAWLNSGPGGIVAALFTVALVVMLILAAGGLL